jgi:ribosome maturation factor RimP
MSTLERVHLVVEPLVLAEGLELYDLELSGGVLRVLVDQPGGAGLDAITRVTRAVSRALDEADPIPGSFTLEVSTPGLERPLRTPAHYQGAIGTVIALKTVAGTPGDRRLRGVLESVDDDGVVVLPDEHPDEPRRVAFADVERARTVFEWGPAPKPGGPKQPRSPSSRAKPAKPSATDPEQGDPRKKVKAS